MKDLDNPPDDIPVNGRDLVTGIPKQVMVSYQEIAEIMNTTLYAVESLMGRAKANLRKELKKYYDNNIPE